MLWLFGMVLAAFSGGSGSNASNFNGLSNFGDKNKNIPPEAGKKVSEVLGAVTSNPEAFFTSIFTQIPLTYWIAIGIGILLIALFYIVLGIFLRNWATGAIFSQVIREEAGMSLFRGSGAGRRLWKRLFLISLVLKGGLFLVSGILFLILVLAIILAPGILKLVAVLFLTVLVLVTIVAYLVVSIWEVSAKLVVAAEDYPFRQAVRFAWAITNKFFWDGLLLGLINQGIGCAVGCLTISIMVMLGIIIFVGFLINSTLGIAFLVVLGIPFLLLLGVGLLIQGIYKAFTVTNWALFYQELKKKSDFPKKV